MNSRFAGYVRRLAGLRQSARRIQRDDHQIDQTASISRDANLVAPVTVGGYTGINRRFTAKGHGPISIGRYCAIGENVTLVSGDHPTQRLAVQFGLYRSLGWNGDEIKTGGISIGSDVWIGDGAIVLAEVSIGDGAVIAAGSVVTKDVDDFAIVGGTPARLLRYRFPEGHRKWIKESNWWRLERDELSDMKTLFEADLAKLSIDEISTRFGSAREQ